MRPESFQCSTSLMPGSCGCRLVMFWAVLASQMLTICLSALMTFRLDPPAHCQRDFNNCHAGPSRPAGINLGIGCRMGSSHAHQLCSLWQMLVSGSCKPFKLPNFLMAVVQAGANSMGRSRVCQCRWSSSQPTVRHSA